MTIRKMRYGILGSADQQTVITINELIDSNEKLTESQKRLWARVLVLEKIILKVNIACDEPSPKPDFPWSCNRMEGHGKHHSATDPILGDKLTWLAAGETDGV